MATVKLPISKSIANRLLLLQAIHGDSLLQVSSDMPDDVLVLHDALQQLQTFQQGEASNNAKQTPLVLNLKNCGTALRFLQVHIAQCYPGEPIILDGDPRLKERDGKPTSQTNSALLMHGVDIPQTPDDSPYITMTRRVIASYPNVRLEADWSAAAFWYEYLAVSGTESHENDRRVGTESPENDGRDDAESLENDVRVGAESSENDGLLLEGLTSDSLQGDRILAEIYAEHFGVTTTFTPSGALIKKGENPSKHVVILDFTNTPDLFPSVALTCERLGMELQATGTERLRFKESDRLEAVRLHEVRNDHRMAMSLLAAGYIDLHSLTLEKKSELQSIIAKSYPQFLEQFTQITFQTRQRHGNDTITTRQRHDNESVYLYENIVPIKGVNDDNLGKKHALSKLIHAASADYLWLHDDDVVWPQASAYEEKDMCAKLKAQKNDLIILPLRMESALSHEGRGGEGLLERLQIAEYAAIQELTMRMAKKGQAVMCSGANLIVRREAWLACEPDIHPEIPSGDDMFLLDAAKRRGFKIGVIDEPDFTAVVRPQTSWRAFFRQRMRWAGKAPHYTDKDIIHCGRVIATLNILQFLCPLIILFKFPAEYGLICRRELTYPSSAPRTSWHVALLLEILYPYYLLICLIGGLFRKGDW